MYYNQTIIIDYGNDRHLMVPNQDVKVIEYADVIFGLWNDKLVAAFYNKNNMAYNNTWHAARQVKHGN